MPDLFKRDFILNAGGLRIATQTQDGEPTELLKIVFQVEKTSQREPNAAKITITNLGPDSRAFLQDQKGIPTTLEVGYEGGTFQIFNGDLTYANSGKGAVDWQTLIQAKDGGRQYRSAVISESFGPGTPVADVIRRVAQAFGDIGTGNLEDAISAGNQRGTVDQFSAGFVACGSVRMVFNSLMELWGFEWSIQDQQLQILIPGQPVDETIVLLTPDTGLIGSPDRGDKGRVKAVSLIQPDLVPGKLVRIESAEVVGDYKITSATFNGDTWGNDWTVSIEGKPVQ